MRAEDIRIQSKVLVGSNPVTVQGCVVHYLAEIAAQLAEINENLRTGKYEVVTVVTKP